jgi:hypothetical protein
LPADAATVACGDDVTVNDITQGEWGKQTA